MPIYEYQCAACGHQLEAIQKFSEEPLKQCPECQKDALTKLMSATSFQLKGTGWYVTDFKDKKPVAEKSASVKTDTEAKPAAAEKTDVKSENKSENKSETAKTDITKKDKAV